MNEAGFAYYHPYLSFASGSTTFFHTSGGSLGRPECDTELSDDALKLWQLGKRAFQQLPEFESVEHFDQTYSEYQDHVRMYASSLEENAHKFVFRGALTGKVLTLDFPEMETGYQIVDIFWRLVKAIGGDSDGSAADYLFACLQEIDHALVCLALDGGAAESIVSATLALERVETTSSESVRLQRARSEFSALGAIERHKRDPKQVEKSFVKDCWARWQKNKTMYSGKASFARDMLKKCETLQSTKVIEDWCREWEKKGKSGTMPAQC